MTKEKYTILKNTDSYGGDYSFFPNKSELKICVIIY